MEKQNKQKEQRPHPCPFCLGTGNTFKEQARHYVENTTKNSKLDANVKALQSVADL